MSSNATPIRFSERHTGWQRRANRSVAIISVNDAGRPTGFATSRPAPLDDKFRTMQSMRPPLKAIAPLLKTLRRGAIRFSIMARNPFRLIDTETSGTGLRIDEAIHAFAGVRIQVWFTKWAAAAGLRSMPHSMAKALDTIATGLLSLALSNVTRPKLMVRPSLTTRASASTSDDATAFRKCVVWSTVVIGR